MAKNKKKNYSEIIHNLTKRHWVWYTIFISSPTIWFTLVVPILSKFFKLQDAQGNYTTVTIVISIIIIILTEILAFFNNKYASNSEFGELENLRGHIAYLEKITDSVDMICDEKATQVKRTIQQVKEGSNEVPKIISKPSNQLNKILEQISVCLVTFMERPDEKYSFKDFFVTLAYNFPEENNEWVWLDGTTERGISLEELTNLQNKTTFNYIRTSQKTYYFNNRKEDARREDRYLYDSFDNTNEVNLRPVGSIFCYNFKVRQGNKTYIDAILSISTQQKRFAEDGNSEKIENAKDNMVRLVKEYFGRRITIELGLLYLEYIKGLEKQVDFQPSEIRPK